MPLDPSLRYQTIQWLMFQMSGIGPMFGQVGFFNKFAGKDYEDKRPRDRYVAESKRLLGVLNERLADRAWIMGDSYSIADIASFSWVAGHFWAGVTCIASPLCGRHCQPGICILCASSRLYVYQITQLAVVCLQNGA